MNAYLQNHLIDGGSTFIGNVRIAEGMLADCVKRRYADTTWTDDEQRADLVLDIRFLPDPYDWERFIHDTQSSSLVSVTGARIAWKLSPAGEGCMQASQPVTPLQFPWHIVEFNTALMNNMESSYDADSVHPLSSIMGELVLGEGSRILPGVVIEGHACIGNNCTVGPNCYLRGNVSIGDNCMIGQSVEIKSSVVGNHTNISHLTYVGDSLIGNNVNIGAGTVISNFRHDASIHSMKLAGRTISTGRNKWGAWIEDDARIGIQTAIYPGRHLSQGSRTLPGEKVVKNK